MTYHEFFDDKSFQNFSELFLKIENAEVNFIAFVYFQFMNFLPNRFQIKSLVIKNFFTSVKNLLLGSYVIHHFHVTGEIIGYAHYLCNLKIRENQNVIPVIAHNLFGLDFFYVVKGIRICVSRTKQLNIGIIDTIRYYQQSLSKSILQTEKRHIRSSCKKIYRKNPTDSANFLSLSDENKEWILEYVSRGKGVIPYEKIKLHEDLNCVPEGEFFNKSEFYSLLKNEIILDQDH